MSTHPEMMNEISGLVREAYGIGEGIETEEKPEQEELPLTEE